MADFVVIEADVHRVTTNVVEFACAAGPKAGMMETAPRAIFRDPDFVGKGDDEIEIASWYATKEGLL